MLTVSEDAAQAISALVAEHQMPESAGLRISRNAESSSTRSEGLQLSIAARPADDDEVVEASGARVFLPPNVINVLHDMQLNVERITQDGEETFDFTVGRQPNAPEIKRTPGGFPNAITG